MKKLAIIVQRAGKDVIGGAEDYALRMGRILSQYFSVDIVTTTAKDHNTWANYFNEGVEKISATLNIIRFKVNIGRHEIWHELNRIFFNDFHPVKFYGMNEKEHLEFIKKIKKIPLGIQEEFIKFQGPYSIDLLNFLKTKNKEYDIFIFITYLYPTTFFCIDIIGDKNRVFLLPTFHDEPYAYLPIFQKYFKYRFLFLTETEKKIAEKLYGCNIEKYHIINFGLEDKYNNDEIRLPDKRYIIYAGRLEEGKGLKQLFEYFQKFLKENSHLDILLYLLGDGPLKSYIHPRIRYMGVVDEDRKITLIKDAIAFIHPSPFESLSISLIESFMVGTPTIVNRQSDVLHEHIRESKAGFSYSSYREFSEALITIINDSALRKELSSNARKYYMDRYNIETYSKNLLSVLDKNG